jgi:hypothetical protein
VGNHNISLGYFITGIAFIISRLPWFLYRVGPSHLVSFLVSTLSMKCVEMSTVF